MRYAFGSPGYYFEESLTNAVSGIFVLIST